MTAMPPNFDPLRFCERKSIPVDDRQKWIETAAYYKAQQRGFTPGRESDDWREAELDFANSGVFPESAWPKP